jgi:hypothetical protein
MFCGPATPSSPFESPGLACSEFARHYYRNHGCFLFLQVLRWFTSLGSLHHPMDSGHGNWCSHQLGSPIRTSPDHRLLAPPRSFSQLATSFFAYLRQGIHTHALSSLTIKLTPLHRVRLISYSCFASAPLLMPKHQQIRTCCSVPRLMKTIAVQCPSDIQLSKIQKTFYAVRPNETNPISGQLPGCD